MDERLAEIEARHAAAWEEMLRVTGMGHHAKDVRGGPPNPARHSIPADPQRDTDLIIGGSLDDVTKLLQTVRALQASSRAQAEEVRALRAVAAAAEMVMRGGIVPLGEPERRRAALDAALAAVPESSSPEGAGGAS